MLPYTTPSIDAATYHVEIVSRAATVVTGNLTAGSTTVSGLSATTGITLGAIVTGTGISDLTIVTALDSNAATVTLSQAPTASGTAVSLSFALEPITLNDAKIHSRVTAEFTDNDQLIASYITGAREYVEGATGHVMCPVTFDVKFWSFPNSPGYYNRLIRQQGPSPGWVPAAGGVIPLPYGPLLSVTSVQYLDLSSGNLTTLDPSYYVVSTGFPARIQAAYGRVFPFSRPQLDSVVVRYVAGYADPTSVPHRYKQAIRFLVAFWYENRESAIVGTISQSLNNTLNSLLDLDGRRLG